MLRHALVLVFVGGLAGVIACGGRDATIDGASSCNGATFSYCGADGRVALSCCPSGAKCSTAAAYCDQGNGRCVLGSCSTGSSGNVGSGDDGSSGGIDGGGVDGGGVDAAGRTTVCGPKTCTGTDVCVITQSGGGPCQLPDDSGNCPDGLPPSGTCCNRTTTSYDCKALPSSCGGSLSCPCAGTLCQCGGCNLAEAPNTMSCGCFYP